MTAKTAKPRLIIIQGPTGVGKSDLAFTLARKWGGEILSADSMQVYRYMDIGTAKPTARELSEIKHHLIDVVNPDEIFNTAIFVKEAGKIITSLHERDAPIFLIGGTGLYIKGLLGGIFPEGASSLELRERYLDELARLGKSHLYDKLREKDPLAASFLKTNDTVRIIRALEVYEMTGQSIREKQLAHKFCERRYDYLKLGLTLERATMYRAIEDRTEQMIIKGLIPEVEDLLARGYHEGLKPMQSLGYKHIVSYLKGRLGRQEAISLTKRDTRRYAKRQLTWFKRDLEIEWFFPSDREGLERKVDGYLSTR